MSKVNRRKEIKEKESLQLKFQLALSQNNKNIQSWLPSSNTASTGLIESESTDRQLFLNLPIVANGAGLFVLEDDEKNRTVGDFLQAEGTPKNVKPENVKDIRNGSKAMAALMNRMRTDNRKNLRDLGNEKVHKLGGNRLKLLLEVKKSQNQSENKKNTRNVESDDSDEEQLKLVQISAKKKGGLAFGKGKKRPF